MAQKNLHILMTADARKVEEALNRVDARLKLMEGAAKKFNTSLSMIGTAVVGGGAVLAAEKAWDTLRDTQKQSLELGKEALTAGGTIEGYSALKFAVADAEALQVAIHRLNIATVEAAEGGNDTAEAFARLGLDAQALLAMPAEQKFLTLAGALEHVENGAVRASEAQKVLGKSALGVLGVMGDLNKGRAELEKWMAFGKAKDKLITVEDVANARAVHAELKMVDADFDEVKRALARDVGPLIAAIAKDIRAAVDGMGDLKFSDSFRRGLIEAHAGFMDMVHIAKGVAKAGMLDPEGMQEEFDQVLGWSGAVQKSLEEVQKWNQRIAMESAKIVEQEKQGAAAVADKVKQEKAAADLKKQQADFDAMTKRVTEMAESPWEKFQQGIAEVDKVAAAGVLSWDQYYAALAAVVDKFQQFNQVQAEQFRPAEALEFGGAAEGAARSRAQTESRQAAEFSGNRVEDLLKQLRDHAKESKDANKETAEALKGLKVARY